MGHLFRSEHMVLCQIFIPSEAAYFVVSELGEIGVVQFRDLNKDVTSFRRNFVSDVRRCHEMERKLRYIQSEIESNNILLVPLSQNAKVLAPNEIVNLEMQISRSEEEMKKLAQNIDTLKATYVELMELKYVLEKSEDFFRKRDEFFTFDELQGSFVNQLNIVTGVINREKVKTFETMLWRICKGNVYFECVQIEKSVEDFGTESNHHKTIFIVCFHGKVFHTRINKLCEGFGVSLYSCPPFSSERKKLLENVKRRLDDINLVITQTYSYRQNFLLQTSNELRYWNTMVSKMKAIYHILNFLKMDVTGKCFIGECWVPFGNIPTVKKALADGSRASACSVFSFLYVVKSTDEPPTFNRTNKFTRCFQKLVDLYGVASYEEVNPAVYSVVTFPFLFAVMFGDVGHALILIAVGLYLIMVEDKVMKKNRNEIFKIFINGRYMILLMGLFSIFTGFVYNDVFSKAVNLFGSSWFVRLNRSMVGDTVNLHPGEEYNRVPYPFGVDPVWGVSRNRIVFLNSYKMKMSIIFGVLHMILGLFNSVVNFIYFEKYSNIFFEFISQLTLLCCLFLWLIAMMFIKWINYSSQNTDVKYGSSCAPSILTSFINMILLKEPSSSPGCDPYFFYYQPEFEKILLIVSLITIVVMFFGKSLYALYVTRCNLHVEEDKLCLKVDKNVEDGKDQSENLQDVFIIQVIKTLEYVLGTVSHTASYLRLWALSLAHSELSRVLWNRLLCLGFRLPFYAGGLTTFVTFSVWAFFTITILVTMEGMSAFLHTLRLHWVEFMSKFYSGNGYAFEPFSFKTILEHEEDEEKDYEEGDKQSLE